MENEFKLTKDQLRIFNMVNDTPSNYLIHGKPGTGKTVLSRHVLENSNKTFTIAAPTGLAALNANGKTLHSVFHLPVSGGIIDPSFNNFPTDPDTIAAIKYQVRALLIDEISMVRADTLDYIDRLLRFVKEVNEPFGGVQVIVIGDFFQLPPVVIGYENQQLTEAGYRSCFAFDSKAFESFTPLFLEEVLRQEGDDRFIEILNSARTGKVFASQLAVLNKQVGMPENPFTIALTATNKEAASINSIQLARLEGEVRKFEGVKYGNWPALPCEENVELKVGAHVMVKKNGADKDPNDYKKGFESQVVNGTMGVVEDLSNKDYVVITTEEGISVKIFRQQWERKVKDKDEDNRWVEKNVASFDQMPLQLAWAISIHKSQGQSFNNVHIHAGRIFAAGQMYVALSRCRKLSGITFDKLLNPRIFFANKDVIRFEREGLTQSV